MPPIRTFDFAWPTDGTIRNITCALGNTAPNSWLLIRTSAPHNEYEPREWNSLAVNATAEDPPIPSVSGNPVFALKNYSENEGILPRLESVGMIQHTGRRHPQGFVQLEMVEVLVPQEELIKSCGVCGQWEEVDQPRFLRCSKCKGKYYCSKECQKENWKEHKRLCKEGVSEADMLAAQTAAEKAKIEAYLKDAGFMTMNLNK